VPDIRDQLRRPTVGYPAWITRPFGQTPDHVIQGAVDALAARRAYLRASDLIADEDELDVLSTAVGLRGRSEVVAVLGDPAYREQVAYTRDARPNPPTAAPGEVILTNLDALRVCALDRVLDTVQDAGLLADVDAVGDQCADLRAAMLARLGLPAEN
jgi:hypothetical protein